jgi:DNA-binding NarL/FixJ family response regulator
MSEAQQHDAAAGGGSPPASVSVAIAAADAIVRAGYARVLETAGAEFVVVAQVGSVDALLDATAARRPRVAMVDLSLPPSGGLDATRRLRELHPGTGVLVFCIAADSDLAMRSFDAGAVGYITRDSDAAAVAQAVRNVAQGKPYLKQEMMQEVALRRVAAKRDIVASLSAREFEVFRLLTEGKSVSEIADALDLSPRSVANYQTQIKRKLGVTTNAGLVHLAIRRGLIRIGEG